MKWISLEKIPNDGLSTLQKVTENQLIGKSKALNQKKVSSKSVKAFRAPSTILKSQADIIENRLSNNIIELNGNNF